MVCAQLENENSSQNVNISKAIVQIIWAVVFYYRLSY